MGRILKIVKEKKQVIKLSVVTFVCAISLLGISHGARAVLSEMHLRGLGNGVERIYPMLVTDCTPDKVLDLSGKSPEELDRDELFQLGICYAIGKGVEKDEKKAIEFLQKAVDKEHAVSMFALGLCYDNGFGGLKQDFNIAFDWYKRAADHGCAYATCLLGECYRKGIGVKNDDEEAIKWYKKAADQGCVFAMFKIGICYMNRPKTPEWYKEPYKESIEWFEKFLAQGGVITNH